MAPAGRASAPPSVRAASPQHLLRGEGRRELEALLPAWLRSARWFGGKARPIKKVAVRDVVPLRAEPAAAHLVLAQVEYDGATTETYALPLAFAFGDEARRICESHPGAVIASLDRGEGEGEGVLYDAMVSAEVQAALLEILARGRPLRGERGELLPSRHAAFRELGGYESLPPRGVGAEQSNSSVVYGEKLVLKLFRRLEEGPGPELELGEHLSRRRFPHSPPLAGSLRYREGRSEPTTVAVLHGFVPNHGDAWQYTLDELARFFERALAQPSPANVPKGSVVELLDRTPPDLAAELVGPYLGAAQLLGRRTAQLHTALCADDGFAPEPYTGLYQRSIYQSMRNHSARVLRLLRRSLPTLSAEIRPEAERLLALEGALHRRFEPFLHHRLHAHRIRVHGDFHLGQVLYTGKDFVVVDFEGEPARPLEERRRKRSPLRDVAGMLRSFHYAAATAALRHYEGALVTPESAPGLRAWAALWQAWTCRAFLAAWLEESGTAPFVPPTREQLRVMLDAFLVEKALYEVAYELNTRPGWVGVPIEGLLQLIGEQGH
ncbi:MAG TPA: putative maltokinase [Myxococcales bacterium]